MSECNCGGCTCGGGLQIENTKSETQASKYEADSMNHLWRSPKMYKHTDGNIDE